MTFISDTEVIYSYSLLGIVGSDKMVPLSPNTCPTASGAKKSYHGTWGKQQIGLGGATASVFDTSQSHIHYLFDGMGKPRFLLASPNPVQSATVTTMPFLQFNAYCATCPEVPVQISEVGTFTRNFATESTGSWTFDYLAWAQTVNRSDQIVKISDPIQCQ